jgi:hypothetical protein
MLPAHPSPVRGGTRPRRPLAQKASTRESSPARKPSVSPPRTRSRSRSRIGVEVAAASSVPQPVPQPTIRTVAAERQRELRRQQIRRDFQFVFNEVEIPFPNEADFYCPNKAHHSGSRSVWQNHRGMPCGICPIADRFQQQIKLRYAQQARAEAAYEAALKSALANA